MGEIRCLCLDVDGVLTDGRLLVESDGRVGRAFHIHDGLGVKLFREAGGEVVIVTGKAGGSIEARARELDIRHIIQNSRDKAADLERLLGELKIEWSAVAMIGDDLPDLPILTRCGCPIAVANAVAEVRAVARFVTERRGGEGAVREAVERLLRDAGKWESLVARYAAATR